MCRDCKSALDKRLVAAKMLKTYSTSERFGIGPGLKAVYGPIGKEPVPKSLQKQLGEFK